jgi:hypothetical protein
MCSPVVSFVPPVRISGISFAYLVSNASIGIGVSLHGCITPHPPHHHNNQTVCIPLSCVAKTPVNATRIEEGGHATAQSGRFIINTKQYRLLCKSAYIRVDLLIDSPAYGAIFSALIDFVSRASGVSPEPVAR